MDGTEATIIACGMMVSRSIEAAQILAGEGMSVRVVEMHTVKPLDDALVERCARETRAIVRAEEHSIIGGLDGAVSERLVQTRPVPVERVGIADTFEESGPYPDLLQKYGMSVESIVGAVHRVAARKFARA